ncbi:flagellar assembly protein A [Helicobacter sp. MIT 14-3879]|uniref:flagellar assembly protein A n=1 Tax=Helicobacter sp. MIT 14-3879 TaxID=2040649 RepID=UPI0015F1ABAA|nr:flagellar assembly protein A [Helicobacter sp. MIT 14-3879]
MQQTKLIKDIENIPELLDNISLKINTPSQNLEIAIVSYKTFVKSKDSTTFQSLKNNLINDTLFENKENIFKQTYDIVIHKVSNEDNKFSLEIKDNAQSLDIVFLKGFIPPKNISEFEALVTKINSFKLKNKILLKELDKEKNALLEYIKTMKSPIEESNNFTLSSAKNFIDSKDSKLIFSIKEVDIAKKNIICVKENELICKFYLASNGKSGRNLRGEYIIPKEKTSNPPSFGENIKEIQEDLLNKYIAKKSGFIIFENNNFSFCNELSLQNIEIKDNYNFVGDLDSDTKLTIVAKNELEDAIKNGVTIRANKVNVNGNIATNTSIYARELNIKGQTHKQSTIIADNANINVHKGNLVSSFAKINSLDGGNIISDDLEILKANGGEIESNNINILELYSNTNIRFANKLIIDTLKGGGNKITFTPLANKSNKKRIEQLLKDLDTQILKEKELSLKLNTLIYKYNKYQQTAKNLKNQIDENNKNDKQIPSYILKNYNIFLQIVESIKINKKEILKISKDKNYITNTIKDYQKTIFDAEFLCKDGWLKYNDIIFELVIPKLSQTTTIIKGIGRYYFNVEEKKIIHQKIFKNNEKKIKNQGF